MISEYQHFSSDVFAGFPKLRALASYAFTPRAIADLEYRIREITRDMLDRMQQLIPQAIEEVLRFRSPVQCLYGQLIKAGQQVAFFIGSANRDESKFADADRFGRVIGEREKGGGP